jgi:hypothetical protein
MLRSVSLESSRQPSSHHTRTFSGSSNDSIVVHAEAWAGGSPALASQSYAAVLGGGSGRYDVSVTPPPVKFSALQRVQRRKTVVAGKSTALPGAPSGSVTPQNKADGGCSISSSEFLPHSGTPRSSGSFASSDGLFVRVPASGSAAVVVGRSSHGEPADRRSLLSLAEITRRNRRTRANTTAAATSIDNTSIFTSSGAGSGGCGGTGRSADAIMTSLAQMPSSASGAGRRGDHASGGSSSDQVALPGNLSSVVSLAGEQPQAQARRMAISSPPAQPSADTNGGGSVASNNHIMPTGRGQPPNILGSSHGSSPASLASPFSSCSHRSSVFTSSNVEESAKRKTAALVSPLSRYFMVWVVGSMFLLLLFQTLLVSSARNSLSSQTADSRHTLELRMYELVAHTEALWRHTLFTKEITRRLVALQKKAAQTSKEKTGNDADDTGSWGERGTAVASHKPQDSRDEEAQLALFQHILLAGKKQQAHLEANRQACADELCTLLECEQDIPFGMALSSSSPLSRTAATTPESRKTVVRKHLIYLAELSIAHRSSQSASVPISQWLGQTPQESALLDVDSNITSIVDNKRKRKEVSSSGANSPSSPRPLQAPADTLISSLKGAPTEAVVSSHRFLAGGPDQQTTLPALQEHKLQDKIDDAATTFRAPVCLPDASSKSPPSPPLTEEPSPQPPQNPAASSHTLQPSVPKQHLQQQSAALLSVGSTNGLFSVRVGAAIGMLLLLLIFARI